jgi:dTDP-glucose pyrophosphorylase
MRAVIFAGGCGTRLAPYTTILLKPLIPIGERSILELIIDQLSANGFDHMTFCVGYPGFWLDLRRHEDYEGRERALLIRQGSTG